MPREQPYELLTKPDLYRENANINQQIVVPLVMLEASMEYMHNVRDRLWVKPEEAPITPMEVILPSVSGWSRSEAMKGSEQLVRSFMGQPGLGTQEGMGQAPILTPPRPPGSPQTVAVVAYQGAQALRKDVRRKRWSW